MVLKAVKKELSSILVACIFILLVPADAATLQQTSETSVEQASERLSALWSGHPLLVVGDLHGTEEIPQIVAQTVRRGKDVPTLLALELPSEEQTLVDKFLKGTPGARAGLLASEFWSRRDNRQDGRSSTAMLGLLRRIGELQRDGWPIHVRCIGGLTDATASDAGMHRAVVAAMEHTPQKRTLVYVGNRHAAVLGDAGPDATLGDLLRDLKPKVVYVSAQCGTIWACGPSGRCGITPLRDRVCRPKQGVTTESGADVGADEIVRIENFTASPPARLK